MTACTQDTQELWRRVEQTHNHCLENIQDLRQTASIFSTTDMRNDRNDQSSSSEVKPVPTSRSPSPDIQHVTTFKSDFSPTIESSPRLGALTLREYQRRLSGPVALENYGHGDDSDFEGEFVLRRPANEDFIPLLPPNAVIKPGDDHVTPVQCVLPSHSYTEEQFARHLQSTDFPSATTIALGDVWKTRAELDPSNILAAPITAPTEHGPFANATYEVYDIGRDGLAIPRHDTEIDQGSEATDVSTVWRTIKDINPEGTAAGRITILLEPSPLMLGAAHMALGKHFDMDELYRHLVTTEGNRGKTRAFVNRAFEQDPIRQRSFFFVFKYYTVVGDGVTPAPWQQFDHRPPDKRSPDHIDIVECSSILALSLESSPRKQIHVQNRRRRTVQHGFVYDTFAPWHLLNIQYYPDDELSVRSEDSRRSFYNGPYAFLHCLSAEYRDAINRYIRLNELITKLITPPNQFLFDVKLRDKLLFEDKDFTYSRRYFWAYNSLGVINDGINSMINAYKGTFTSDFWTGRHQTLWPHPDPDSVEGRNYLDKLAFLRQDLERAVLELEKCFVKNEATRKEIKSLRDQLFSGSSVKESRRAIEQGDNIKILTSVSMVFLPLTFVTSVFGITEFHIPADNWRFPLTILAVCVPFFVLILMLMTRRGTDLLKRTGRFLRERWDGGARQTRREPPQAKSGADNSSGGPAAAASRRRRMRPLRRPRALERRLSHVGHRRDGDRRPWWRHWGRKGAAEGAGKVVGDESV